MKNLQYFNFANKAALYEKGKEYGQAAMFWGKAADCALHYQNRIWAKYRKEHNEIRDTLYIRYEEECKRIANRKTDMVLNTHIEKVKNNFPQKKQIKSASHRGTRIPEQCRGFK
ncbi:ANR family transcriptional regulator [Xenorhabdus bovienii]|uniref:ANR family transcriptional regulator n=1 Tax=Xenorhabdus bovienii TaxID=40576 RepID=UPI0023B2284D|nr:ANR family transcriptional regulator [Xenorhabdus bovienii]MDE9556711.1 ANR family transcriptional regulator [Xenorhabdus bovienii]